MTKVDDFEEREKRVREFLREQAKRAIELRSKDREFHGLEREFVYHQAKMISDYEQTKDIKHPRDLGNTREHILRTFISDSGYIPKRYSVSNRSVRIVSTSGHISNEIDAAFYDPMESSTLMNRQDVYEVYPIEGIYGVIQIKSILTKKELLSALQNIDSFKKLQKTDNNSACNFLGSQARSETGFGIIFAYISNMKWIKIVDELNKYTKISPNKCLPNAVFILDRGFFLFGDESHAVFKNQEIEALQSPRVHGFPDRKGECLFSLTSIILSLLRTTVVKQTNIDTYYRLPLIAKEHSYNFMLGALAEIGSCEKHGDYARKISPESLEKIVQFCASTVPINSIKAIHIAYGLPHDEEAYRRQPGDVRIYNPENIELSNILVSHTFCNITYDIIDTNGFRIYLPYYYSIKECLISTCQNCSKPARKHKNIKKMNT